MEERVIQDKRSHFGLLKKDLHVWIRVQYGEVLSERLGLLRLHIVWVANAYISRVRIDIHLGLTVAHQNHIVKNEQCAVGTDFVELLEKLITSMKRRGLEHNIQLNIVLVYNFVLTTFLRITINQRLECFADQAKYWNFILQRNYIY